jgi:hypothetical protein
MRMEIPKMPELEQRVFSIFNENEFERIALEVYHFQFSNNPVYQDYCRAIYKTPENVREFDQIPFLPISLFKSHRITSTDFEPEIVFKSSGTTGDKTSRHFVRKAALYEKSFLTCFEKFYGSPAEYCILGLLPSYLERDGSSLVYMVDHLIQQTNDPRSGFYLNDLSRLHTNLRELEKSGKKTMLIGVSYALLDFASEFQLRLENTIILETGGMKGRRKEMLKTELYDILKNRMGVNEIHSEYGMTELLSQAYAIDGLFQSPPWMKVLLRDETDPLSANKTRLSGAINIVDLANLYSCSFLATDDIGKLRPGKGFEVLGRMDHSDVRGCSLLLL